MENNLAKIAILPTADEALNQAIEKVNKDFSGGRVTKTDLATWFITQEANSLTDAKIEKIQKAHFNKVVYLKSLAKKLKADGRETLNQAEIIIVQSMLEGQKVPKALKSEATKPHEDVNKIND